MNEKNVIWGIHAVNALLKKHPTRILQLIVSKERHDERIQELLRTAEQFQIKIEFRSRHALDTFAKDERHQGIIALCQKARTYSEQDLEKILMDLTEPAFLLVLDGVQDPHNLGACLRSADAAGVHAVIAPKDKSVSLTSTVCKVASGAAETVPFIQVTNLARTLRFLKDQNIWIYGAAAEAQQTVFDTNLTSSLAYVLGAEGLGLRRLTRDHCDFLLTIPMNGSVSSLNVSVAAGIFLFEAVRQRR